jgi:hypothetical protein
MADLHKEWQELAEEIDRDYALLKMKMKRLESLTAAIMLHKGEKR